MTASKQTSPSTALARVLALPLMAGTLVACDYASRLPDAPSQLGYELANKPPSVVGNPAEKPRLPAPPDALTKLEAPVEYRSDADSSQGNGLLKPNDFQTRQLAAAPEKPALPEPESAAFAPLEFEVSEGATEQVDATEFSAPPLDLTAAIPQAVHSPITETGSAPIQYVETEPLPLDSTVIDTVQPNLLPTPIDAAPSQNISPVAILHTRLSNGAVINVHPVIGAPGPMSSALGRSIVSSIGTRLTERDARYAHAAFDLRGRAERNTAGYTNVEWTLHDRNDAVVGVFSERHDQAGWDSIGEQVVEAMGRRVADRLDRNAELRRATLYAVAEAPIDARPPAPRRTFARTHLVDVPTPRVSPRPQPQRAKIVSAPPKQVVAAVPIQHSPILSSPPKLVMPNLPAAPKNIVAPVAAPVTAPTVSSQVPTLAAAPPPSFDTLRAGNTTTEAAPVIASGPRPLVFQGVKGAPGDGDQSLSREVAKLLSASGANVASSGGPEALYLTAQVSKTPSASADRIEIVWSVQDSNGASIGQVTQANDVPRGALDQSWGDDAIYAAEGAKDGIMELLQSSGALDS